MPVLATATGDRLGPRTAKERMEEVLAYARAVVAGYRAGTDSDRAGLEPDGNDAEGTSERGPRPVGGVSSPTGQAGHRVASGGCTLACPQTGDLRPVVADRSGVIAFRRFRYCHPLHRRPGAAQYIERVFFAPDGATILGRGHEKVVYFWDSGAGNPIGELRNLDMVNFRADQSPDLKEFAQFRPDNRG